MLKRSAFLMCFVLCMCFAGSIFASTNSFCNNSGDRLWMIGTNWENGLPTADFNEWSFVTYIVTWGSGPDGPDGPIVQNGDSAVAGNLVIGYGGFSDGDAVYMEMTGGTLDITNDFWIGKDDGQTHLEAPGVFNISGGDLTVSGNGILGVSSGANGTINQIGGTVTVNYYLVLDWLSTINPEYGVYNLHGGTLDIGNISVRGHGSIDIGAGVMTIADNLQWYMADLVDSGQLTAYGGQGIVLYDYDVTNPGKTTVWAVQGDSGNFLSNGSFEAPDIPEGTSQVQDPDGWLVYQGVTMIDDANLATDEDQFVELAHDADFYQIVTLQPGRYILSFDYTGKVGQAGDEAMLVRTWEHTSDVPENIVDRILYYNGVNSYSDPDWQHIEYSVNVTLDPDDDPNNFSVVEFIGVDQFAPSANENMWIDKVQLKSVDDGFKLTADVGWDVFTNVGYDYRYGPSFIINDDSSIDMWTASPGGGGEWDWIRHKKSTDDGLTWGSETVALRPTPGSADAYSVCDPGVVKFGGYYYIGYTSTTNSGGVGIENDTFVARSTSPTGPYDKWNGSGWGGNPQPIIEYTDTPGQWGCGEPCFVVVGDTLYIYYTWNNGVGVQTRVATADATDLNWPADITLVGVAIQKASDSDSSDVKYVDAVGKFIAVNTARRFTDQSYIQVWTSLDGLTFTATDDVSTNIQLCCHNAGISGDEYGHIITNEFHFIAYAYGSTWGNWSTHLNPVTICDTDYTMDFNFDCTVDFFDFAMFATEWQGLSSEMDFDGSGTVDIADLEEFAKYWLENTLIN